MTLLDLDKRIEWLWVITGSLGGLIIGSIISTILYISTGSTFSAVMIPVFFSLGAFYGWKRYSNWGFGVREDHLYIEHGVLKKTYSMVPFVRVQHVDTDRGPVDRFLGLSTLRVYTAGSKGADIKIPGLESSDAAKFQEKLRDAAIRSERGFDAV